MNSYKLVSFFILTITVNLLITACQTGSSENESPVSDEQKESVEVRPQVLFSVADKQPIYQYIESQGLVEASQSVKLKSRISGYVEWSAIEEGKKVQKGDTLLIFDHREYIIEETEALNAFEEALQKYKLEMKMRKGSGNGKGNANGIGADTDNDGEDGSRLVRIRTGLAQAEVDLKRARLNLSYSVITAPFTGVISTDERLDAGTYITSGTTIGQLVDTRRVRIKFDILESEYLKVKESMAVQLVTPNGDEDTGIVEAIDPVVDSETKTGTVVVKAQNSNRLLTPGMTVEGRIRIEQQQGKARVPRSAILSRDGGRTLLFKLNSENDEVQWIYVEPVAQNNEWAIINHPNVHPGDTIAVDNHFALSHLQIVEPVMQVLQ